MVATTLSLLYTFNVYCVTRRLCNDDAAKYVHEITCYFHFIGNTIFAQKNIIFAQWVNDENSCFSCVSDQKLKIYFTLLQSKDSWKRDNLFLMKEKGVVAVFIHTRTYKYYYANVVLRFY